MLYSISFTLFVSESLKVNIFLTYLKIFTGVPSERPKKFFETCVYVREGDSTDPPISLKIRVG